MVAKHLQLALVGLLVTVAQRAAGQQPIIGFADPVIRNVPENIGSFSVCVELIDPDALDNVLQVRVMAQGFNQPIPPQVTCTSQCISCSYYYPTPRVHNCLTSNMYSLHHVFLYK